MLFTARLLKLIPRLFLALLALLLILLLGAFYLLQRNPEALTNNYLEKLSARTGLEFSVESVDVVLLPVPSVAVSGARVQGKKITFSVAYATLTPHLWPLLRGELQPASISLLRPRLQGSLALPLRDPVALRERVQTIIASGRYARKAHAPASRGLPDFLQSCHITVSQGDVLLEGDDGSELQLEALQCRVKLNAPDVLKGRVQVASVLHKRVGSLPVQIQQFSLEGEGNLLGRLADMPKLKVSGTVNWPEVLDGTAVAVEYRSRGGQWTASGSLQGRLLCDGFPQPLSLEGTVLGPRRKQPQGTLSSFVGALEEKVQARLDLNHEAEPDWQDMPDQQIGPLLQAGPVPQAASGSRKGQDSHAGGQPVAETASPQPETTAAGSPAAAAGTGPETAKGPVAAAAGAESSSTQKDGPVLDWHSGLRFKDVKLALGPDSGHFDGSLLLAGMGGKEQGFALGGRLHVQRASLTQWLGFARNLTPGLQLALDNLTQGTLDFMLDEKGLQVPYISVHAAGARFVGSGSVPTWSHPEVRLDLTTPRLRLEHGLPEALGVLPSAPYFPHKTLTPMPGEPLLPGEVGVDYHIQLGAQQLFYGPLQLKGASVLIVAGALDKITRLEDTLIEAEAELYGGRMQGRCILGGDRSLPQAITASLSRVDGKPLRQALPILPMENGLFSAEVSITSQGRELATFLNSLRGTARVQGSRGRLTSTANSSTLPFEQLDLALKLRRMTQGQKHWQLQGLWEGKVKNAAVDAAITLDGTLLLGGSRAGLTFRDVPGQLSARLSPAFTSLSEPVRVEVQGNFSLDGNDGRVTLNKARGRALGVDFTTSLQGGGQAGAGWSGSVSASSQHLASSLKQLMGRPVELPSWLQALTLSGDFQLRGDSLKLSDLRTQVDKSQLSGGLTLKLGKVPHLDFELTADRVDLNEYLKEKSSTAQSVPWDFPFMRQFSARGLLRVKELEGWRFRLHDLHVPVVLEKGVLESRDIHALFYGARLHCQTMLDFTRGLRFKSSVSVTDFDLTAASLAKGGDTMLTGRASVSSEVHAALTGSGQLPQALNGAWHVNVRDGSYQARDSTGNLKGKPTKFSRVMASGDIVRGVAHSSDVLLSGDGLQVTGGGWLNMKKETLDCNFTVNMRGIPDFPIRVYGRLDKMKTSIGAAKLLLNTLGGITHGFVDVLGGVVEGSWGLFR